jgi:hypothetical protein
MIHRPGGVGLARRIRNLCVYSRWTLSSAVEDDQEDEEDEE